MRRKTPFDQFNKASYPTGFSIIAFLLRVVVGALMFLAGWVKVTTDWSAAGYLEHATGPFASWFQSLAGNVFVDQLNAWGLLLIGAALILGLLVRTASGLGIVLMLLYYFAAFESNIAHGYIDEHIVYAFVFALFIFGGFGHIWGLDSVIERHIPNKKKWMRALFG
ncbi:DoxX family membrane protein [Candidatus Uhrbacteria bacterium]|jgi:thiosulfate dehydrogenase (quinone) large subunit|nr:DoxX family membrane protein [Candidatus Uhrbacteria bacterium]